MQRLKTAAYWLVALTCPRKKQWRISLGSMKWESVALLRPNPKCVTEYEGAMKLESALRLR